jgi:hypothetical protein
MRGTIIAVAFLAACIGFALLSSENPATAGYGCHGPTLASPPVAAPVAVGCSASYAGYKTILRSGKARRMERRANRRYRKSIRRSQRHGCASYAATCSAPAAPVGCNGG